GSGRCWRRFQCGFLFPGRRRRTSSVSAFLLNRSSDLDGWFIVFDTLTLADDRLEAFYENSHAKHWDYHKTPLIGRQPTRSEERFSRNAETDLVCRLLLEKKKHSLHHYNSRDQASS